MTTYKSSNYLIKKGGTWRAIASHVSGVKEQPSAGALTPPAPRGTVPLPWRPTNDCPCRT